MKTRFLFLCLLLSLQSAFAQSAYRALFIGNSYTYVNDLPAILRGLTLAGGDTLGTEQSTPGGYTFQMHVGDATTLNYLNSPNFDFLILQEQSQRPSFPQSQVQQQVYPYATQLDTLFHNANPCGQTVFYMTWGRKYGDAQNCAAWPPVCTYEGMQYELRRSYLNMAQQNSAIVAPVGIAWWEAMLRDTTLELYNPDESHPSLAGSYLAACVFYATIYRSNPVGLTHWAGLDSLTASFLQDVAADVVFDSLSTWRIGLDDLSADFSVSTSGALASFSDLSNHASAWHWDFGDGNTSNQQNPQHSYAASGTYAVTLTVNDGCDTLSHADSVSIVIVGMAEALQPQLQMLPNPSDGLVRLQGQWPQAEMLSLQLTDMQGRLCWTRDVQASNVGLELEIDLGELPAGSYLLQARSASHAWQQRVILR